MLGIQPFAVASADIHMFIRNNNTFREQNNECLGSVYPFEEMLKYRS